MRDHFKPLVGKEEQSSGETQNDVKTESTNRLSKLLFFQGQYVKMSCSRLGSRVLEAIWNSASISHRQSIAQELGNGTTNDKPTINIFLIIQIWSLHPEV